MACEQALEGFGSQLNLVGSTAKQATNHGKHIGPGADQWFCVFCSDAANGRQWAPETLGFG